MRDEIEVRQTSTQPVAVDLDVELGADFAHVFDVKGGRHRAPATDRRRRRRLADVPRRPRRRRCGDACALDPSRLLRDPAAGTLSWHLELAPRGSATISISVDRGGLVRQRERRRVVRSIGRGNPRLPRGRMAAAGAVGGLHRPAPRSGDRSGARRPRFAAHRRPGAPRSGVDCGWRSVVHDVVRPRLVAHGADDAVVRSRSGARRAPHTRRSPGNEVRPGIGRTARQDRPRAPASGQRRHVQCSSALLRHCGRNTPCSSCSWPKRGGGAPSAATS